MQIFWGCVMMTIGLQMVIWSTTTSKSIIYQILCDRSKPFWGENVHLFYRCSGVAIILSGLLFATKDLLE